jgi:quinol-cytochrome oxidoreductase complex cytochrome b subunit
MNIVKDIWLSISRRDPLSTDKGKSEFVFHNLWLHIHPAKVRKDSLQVKHTWYLGFISFYLLLILITTGIALMFYYRPYPAVAYRDIRDLQFVVFLGGFIRNMHRWAAHGMVACVFLHMSRVFYTGSYKKPRQFNWVIGVFLLILTLGLSFTGYLLPWDQLAFWAITVGTNIGSYAPVIGQSVRELLLGGHAVGEAALIRFYVLHVAVLPILIVLLTMVHFWRIRKDGGLSRPVWQLHEEEPPTQLIQVGVPAEQSVSVVSASPSKTYGLMEVVVGKPLFETVAPQKEEDAVMAYPYAFLREGVALMLTVVTVMVLSMLWNAPLEEMANPARTPNPAKAPWYFLGLQELVSYSALIGGVVVPGVIVLVLLAIPYLDRNPSRRFERRKVAVWAFTIFAVVNLALVVIGTFFRGPGWAFVPPWVHVVAGVE